MTPKEKETSERQRVVKYTLSQKKYSAAEVEQLCKARNIEYEKGDEEKVVEFVASDEKPDREGDIMKMDGMDAEDFLTNPVFMFVHDLSTIPIGNVIKLSVDKSEAKNPKMVITSLFQTVTDIGKELCALTKKGVIRAVSIGFRGKSGGVVFPKDSEREALGMRQGGVIYEAWELFEVSLCPVGMNANALKKSKVSAKTFAMLTGKKEITLLSEDIEMTKDELKAELAALVKNIHALTAFDPSLATIKSGETLTAEHVSHIHEAHKCLTKALTHTAHMMQDHPTVPEKGEEGGEFSEENEKCMGKALQNATKGMIHLKSLAFGMSDPDEQEDEPGEDEEEDDDDKEPKAQKPRGEKRVKSNIYLAYAAEKGMNPKSEIELLNEKFTGVGA